MFFLFVLFAVRLNRRLDDLRFIFDRYAILIAPGVS